MAREKSNLAFIDDTVRAKQSTVTAPGTLADDGQASDASVGVKSKMRSWRPLDSIIGLKNLRGRSGAYQGYVRRDDTSLAQENQ